MIEQVAKFRFLGYKILKSSIEVQEGATGTLNIAFTRANFVEESTNIFKSQIDIAITNNEESVKIDVSAIGSFEFDNDLPADERKAFFNSNAPAILFPYVRAYIGALTSLSGMNPVLLPTLNLSGRREPLS
jgi:preprotein translocase subunit SecB